MIAFALVQSYPQLDVEYHHPVAGARIMTRLPNVLLVYPLCGGHVSWGCVNYVPI